MEPDERKIILSRMGTFFYLIGLGMLVLFVASDLGAVTYFSYFFLGAAGFGLGWFLKRISAPPPSPSQRFAGLRKMMEKRREAEVKREAERKAKQKK